MNIKIALIFLLLLSGTWSSSQVKFRSSLNLKIALKKKYRNNSKIWDDKLSKKYSGSVKNDMQKIYKTRNLSFINKIEKNTFILDFKLKAYIDDLWDEISSNNNLNKEDFILLIGKDYSPNAYCLGDGTLVVNLNLFKYLESEDELVFVICHEVAHQVLEHLEKEMYKDLTFYKSKKHKKKIKKLKKTKFNKGDQFHDYYRSLMYKDLKSSRNFEIQADSLGLHYYRKLKRNKENIFLFFDHLSEVDIAKDSLNKKDYEALLSYKKSSEISSKNSLFTYDNKTLYHKDSLKTHPHTSERKAILKQYFSKKDSVVYPKKEEAFRKWKAYSKYKLPWNLYDIELYGYSLYESLLLLKNNPGNKSINKLVISNLEKLLEAKRTYRLNSYLPTLDSSINEKNNKEFFDFIRGLSLSELEEIINKLKDEK